MYNVIKIKAKDKRACSMNRIFFFSKWQEKNIIITEAEQTKTDNYSTYLKVKQYIDDPIIHTKDDIINT